MSNWANFPFSPKRVPFFYGWVMIVVATIGTISSIPGQTMGVSVFTDPLMATLRLTREQISLAYMFGTITSAGIMLKAGGIIDKFGTRVTMMAASVSLGFSLLLTANSGVMLDSLKPEGEGGALGFAIAFVCFFAIRFFGQGIMALVPRVALGRWFHRYRGRVFGVSGLFISFGFALTPLGLNGLIENYTWQGAYYRLALAVAVGMGLLSFVFFRERPEDYAMNQDGAPDREEGDEGSHLPHVRDYTVQEARKTGAFWVFTAGLSSQSLVVTAITFHIVSLTLSNGLEKEQGLAFFLPIAITGVLTSLIAGFLNDRGMKLPHLLIIMMLAQATGTLSVIFMDQFVGRALLAVGFGISGGMFGTLVGVAWPQLFGLAHLGAISGLNMSIMVFSSAIGPSLFAVAYQRLGSYTPGVLVCATLPLAVLVAAMSVKDPQNLPPERPVQSP